MAKILDSNSPLPQQDPTGISAAMASIMIVIAYDGEQMRETATPNAMNVRDLAPALIAFADVFEECNKVLHGNEAPPVNVKITPDFQPGSFEVCLNIAQSPINDLLRWFSDGQPSGLANLLDVLFGCVALTSATSTGVFKAIKWIRGRKIQKTEILDDGNVKLIIDGDSLVIKRNVANVLADAKVRQAIIRTLDPLRRDDIDTFEVRREPKKKRKGEKPLPPIETIRREELPIFEPPPPVPIEQPKVTNTTYDQSFTIISLTFKDGNKWKVSDGRNPIGVIIEDADFIRRVNNREEVFAKDDIIRCTVRQEQVSDTDGLKTNYAITKVLEHAHVPRQILLPLPIEQKKSDA